MQAQETTLIKVDATANNNKFYRVNLHEDGNITISWGRVGAKGASESRSGGEVAYHRIIKAKEKRGYKAIEVESTSPPRKTVDAKRLEKVALSTLAKGSVAPALTSAISFMAECNRHNIIESSGGMLQVAEDGIVKTALGLVASSSLEAAEKVLDQVEKGVDPQKRRLLTSDYLMLVPQRVKGRRWDETFFTEDTTVQDQRTLLRQLRSSLALYDARRETAAQESDDAFDPQQFADLFSVTMAHNEDEAVAASIQKFFQDGINQKHTSRHMRISNIFNLTYGDDVNQAFEKLSQELGNQKLLWHGTDAGNVLSILREGLYVPPFTDTKFRTSGRMFSDGVYLSDQATKSLNYSAGYWKGGRERRCFMFLADAIMGTEYRPHLHPDWERNIHRVASLISSSGKPYNSTFVKGGAGIVHNNEMIVWNTKQIRLRHLVEFVE